MSHLLNWNGGGSTLFGFLLYSTTFYEPGGPQNSSSDVLTFYFSWCSDDILRHKNNLPHSKHGNLLVYAIVVKVKLNDLHIH